MNQDLRSAIRRIAGNGAQVQVCEVISVDNDTRTAVVKDVAEFTANLMPEVADGLMLIPAVGSSVYVLQGVIIGYSDIDEIWLRGTQYGGLVRVSDLVDKLNALENKVNGIINTFNLHTHAGTGSPPTPTITGTLTPTQITDIENTKVQHG